MVPDELQSLKDNACNPHIVSIGPYHYLDGNLQDMKAQNWTTCYIFFIEQTIQYRPWIIVVRPFKNWANVQVIKQDTSLNDPIADNAWMVSRLRHDLLRLGNQIPFVIQKLYDIIKEQPQPQQPRPQPKRQRKSGFDLCASELIKTGIQFIKNDSGHLLDIKFNGNNGVIEIPPLSIDELESPLRNLITLEQCCFSPYHVTSYAFMMRSLIRSSVDAELLQLKGIIISDLETGQDVSDLIRGICKNVVFSRNFYFDGLCKKVKEYRASRCHWQRQKAIWTFRSHIYLAELKRDYFSSPWKVIAFLAGLVLLILTGLQTFYTVRSYYPH
ncbi:hypothetical protein AAG906_036529 [Vitis piasezkii]